MCEPECKRCSVSRSPARLRPTVLGGEGQSSVGAHVCDRFRASRELSDGTVRKMLSPLRACLATAVREGLIRHNPARDGDLPQGRTGPEDESDIKVLSRIELETFLGIAHPDYRLFFELLAVTGVRVSEAIGLQWRHLQLDGSAPHVKIRQGFAQGKPAPLKTRNSRRDIPIDHEFVVALRERRAETEWPEDEHYVFYHWRGYRTPGQQPTPACAETYRRGSGRSVDWVPHLPAHVRFDPFRRRPQRGSSTTLARTPLGSIHAGHVCASP